VYTFESRGGAEAYRTQLEKHVPPDVELNIVQLDIDEKAFAGLKRIDLRGNDDLAESFVARHSTLYGAGEPSPFEHVIRPTNLQPEHFFTRSVFPLFKVNY
jgi:hypothetical protein